MKNQQPNEQVIRDLFHQSVDLTVHTLTWFDEEAIICFYETLVNGVELNEQLDQLKRSANAGNTNWGTTAITSSKPYSKEEVRKAVSSGMPVLIFPASQMMIQMHLQNPVVRSPEEPINEHVVRGPHEGFVESFDKNMALIRKKLPIADLVVRTVSVGSETKTHISYVYVASLADADVVQDIENRLQKIDANVILGPGQVEDHLEDSVWSPFPQFLSTERPDRTVSNLMEGKIAIITDHSPTVLIAPITFFSFYQSPDDFNGRVYVGSFYRLLRMASLLTAIYLPAIYIAVVSFHSEILPIQISKQVKLAVDEIPYRPVFEALLLELIIELIREATIRLPTPIGQTIGIVGGLVLGDAIVSAGLVSNLMVIVVALTAISSFVVPSVEMNMTVRILRFPFMLAATLFGFFGIVIGTLFLFIHSMNLTSLRQPYFSPIIPFDASRLINVFFRVPYNRYNKQQKSFSLSRKKNGDQS